MTDRPQCWVNAPLGDRPEDWVYIDEDRGDVVYVWTGQWEAIRDHITFSTADVEDTLRAMLTAFKAKVKETT